MVDSEIDTKLGEEDIFRLSTLLQDHLDKLECNSTILSGSISSSSLTDDDKITLAVETLTNMTDFGSFKTTMLAKQAAMNMANGGTFYKSTGAVETVINEEGMNIEILSIDSLIESTEKLRYAAATPEGWER